MVTQFEPASQLAKQFGSGLTEPWEIKLNSVGKVVGDTVGISPSSTNLNQYKRDDCVQVLSDNRVLHRPPEGSSKFAKLSTEALQTFGSTKAMPPGKGIKLRANL